MMGLATPGDKRFLIDQHQGRCSLHLERTWQMGLAVSGGATVTSMSWAMGRYDSVTEDDWNHSKKFSTLELCQVV